MTPLHMNALTITSQAWAPPSGGSLPCISRQQGASMCAGCVAPPFAIVVAVTAPLPLVTAWPLARVRSSVLTMRPFGSWGGASCSGSFSAILLGDDTCDLPEIDTDYFSHLWRYQIFVDCNLNYVYFCLLKLNSIEFELSNYMIAFAIDLVNYRVYANMPAIAFTTFFRTASLANSSSTFLKINRYNALCISWHVKLAEISVDR